MVATDSRRAVRKGVEMASSEYRTVSAPSLWRLCIQERQLSGVRRSLHRRIDGGRADASVLEQERLVSAERRELHRLIDVLGGRFSRAAPMLRRNASW